MSLEELRERIEAEISLMRHFWDTEQWWRLGVSIAKIHHYTREAEWLVNKRIFTQPIPEEVKP